MIHACIPCTLESWGGWIALNQEFEINLGNTEKPCLYLKKYKKISQAWWRMPVIPATQEAEEGESLEPRRQRLQWAKITPLHSSLGNRARSCLKKKKKRKKRNFTVWKVKPAMRRKGNNNNKNKHTVCYMPVWEYPRHFTSINSFSPRNNPMRLVVQPLFTDEDKAQRS